MTSRSDSESRASPRFVEPFKSEKKIVTVFRVSCFGSSGASAVPQNPQRRNFGGFSSPQLGQICTNLVYGAGPGTSSQSSAGHRADGAPSAGGERERALRLVHSTRELVAKRGLCFLLERGGVRACRADSGWER